MNRLAQNGYQLLEPSVLPGGDNLTPSFAEYFSGISITIFALAVTLAVLMIVIGGVEYILAGTLAGKEDGRNRIRNAIVGLIILILIYLILFVINPDLLNLDAFIKTLGTK